MYAILCSCACTRACAYNTCLAPFCCSVISEDDKKGVLLLFQEYAREQGWEDTDVKDELAKVGKTRTLKGLRRIVFQPLGLDVGLVGFLVYRLGPSGSSGLEPPQKKPKDNHRLIDIWDALFDVANPQKPGVFEEDFEGKVVELKAVEPLGQFVPRERIFRRSCYDKLFKIIWEKFDKAKRRTTITVSGTPGIGKSLFGLLFLIELVRFLQRGQASSKNLVKLGTTELNGCIVYEHVRDINDEPDFYLIDTSRKTFTVADVRPVQWFFDKNGFLIKDGPCSFRNTECPTLWTSSPRAGAFQNTMDLGPSYFLPPWTADELVECWRAKCAPTHDELFSLSIEADKTAREAAGDTLLGLEVELSHLVAGDMGMEAEAVLRRWSADLGPVARRVFGPSVAYTRLKNALGSDLSKESMDKMVEIATTSTDYSGQSTLFKNSHRVLLMIPSDDFTTYNFIPSSVKIGCIILQKKFQSDVNWATSLVGSMSGAHFGLVFEPYAHFVLARGGTFTLRNLVDNATEELTLPSMTTKEISNSELKDMILRDREYYRPTDQMFAVVDSWTKDVMFQMTVSMTHAIKSTSPQFEALKGKGPKRIIFVVPKGNASEFQLQKFVTKGGGNAKSGGLPRGGWNKIAQFVLGL